ncbi:hypothetical protein QEV83_15960 [Methylocapsa sp. D3K7]|uniref:hypothetical protein n=1 Tax=Methylocapsa sp. D3K7 TaxID=3041435 RepID=UPI00244EF7F7|nr:hypothetical protein [Methylocapsa sp. D3K7]WGJ14130.1 hypothetical protein QEV83_15960 [Methylocapsa sp. D3K7]
MLRSVQGTHQKDEARGLDSRGHSVFAIHLMAATVGEAESLLSRMCSTGFAGASEARVLDRLDPLAKLAAVQ